MAKFEQYKVFIATVETGSISGAARRLHLSASAVSKQLTALENAMNVQLFDRSNRNVKVTSLGKTFFQKCKEIVENVNQAEESLLSTKNAVAGRLSVTMSKSLARSQLFHVLTRFSEKYPSVYFDIDYSDDIVDLHETGTDFAFRLGRLDDSSRIVAIPLYDVRLIFCAAPSYIERYGTLASFTSLKEHKLTVLSPFNISRPVRTYFKRERIIIDPSVNHTATDIEAVYQSVRAGLSIGLLLDVTIRTELEKREFVDIFPDKRLPSKKLYLLYKKNALLTRKQKIFKSFVKDYGRIVGFFMLVFNYSLNFVIIDIGTAAKPIF